MSRSLTWTSAAVVRRPGALGPVLTGVGRVIGGALDGLVIGLVVAFVVGVGLGAPEAYLPVPWPVAVLGLANAAAGVGAVGALLALGGVRLVGLAGGRIADSAGRTHPTLGRRLRSAVDGLRGLPAGWLGAFAVFLAIALAGRRVSPLGILTPPGILTPYVYLTGVAGAVLGACAALADDRRSAPGRSRRGVARAGVVLTLTSIVLVASIAIAPGSATAPVAYDAAFDAGSVIATVPDPGAPGPYVVDHWAYGHPTDARSTAPVDASGVLPRLESIGPFRDAYFGFGTDALPLRGLAWVPRGDGPFPLVLIVHGNHAMGADSAAGYRYLGEHLASRGFITASIDEGFLNGSWAGDWEGREQQVRAWLLLLHLDRWRAWGEDPADELAGRVDLDRVALIGHSRGGEAAAIAAMLASRDTAPSSRMEPWPTGLKVRAVVAIAPSDGQVGTTVVLEGVDFLTLSGGYDADARAWSGLRQYARTRLGPDDFKAALYAYRANHGQFNEVWGRGDFGPWSGAVLDLGPLLTAEEQEDVARTSIGAFLEGSLLERTAYRGFFRRPMMGRAWLPDDIVVVRSAAGATRPLVVAGDRPIDGVMLVTEGSMQSDSRAIPLRALQVDQGAQAALLRWSGDDPAAAWRLTGSDDRSPSLDRGSSIVLSLADGRTVEAGGGPPTPLRVALELVTTDGQRALIPLDRYGAVPPPLAVRLVKPDVVTIGLPVDLTLRSPAEVVLQTYAVSIDDVMASQPGLRPERIESLAIRPLGPEAGALWVGEVGVTP